MVRRNVSKGCAKTHDEHTQHTALCAEPRPEKLPGSKEFGKFDKPRWGRPATTFNEEAQNLCNGDCRCNPIRVKAEGPRMNSCLHLTFKEAYIDNN